MAETANPASIQFVPPENIDKLGNKMEILFSDSVSCEMALDMFIDDKIQHLIQKSNFNTQDDFNCYHLSKMKQADFLKYPLCTIMGEVVQSQAKEAELSLFKQNVTARFQKHECLSEVEKCLNDLKINQSILSDSVNVMDELFTNAAISAPRIASELILREKDHAKIQEGEELKPFDIFLGADSQRIIIGCKDYYGVLDKNIFLKSIRRCFSDDLSKVIRFNFGGAGIGAFLMYRSCASLYFGVSENKETVVCFSLARKMSRLDRDKMPKNIHFFSS